jgi:hypothetical protein
MRLHESIRRILREETEQKNKSYTLYVDMGGVLFKKMGADEGGSGDETDYIGSELWEGIKKYNPTILSSTGTKDIDGAKKTKREQVKDYLNPIPSIVFVTSGKDKGIKYGNENSILIDDSQTNIDSWVGNDGIGIKHSSDNVGKTLSKLKQLYEY